jgi:hypothetical protein
MTCIIRLVALLFVVESCAGALKVPLWSDKRILCGRLLENAQFLVCRGVPPAFKRSSLGWNEWDGEKLQNEEQVGAIDKKEYFAKWRKHECCDKGCTSSDLKSYC